MDSFTNSVKINTIASIKEVDKKHWNSLINDGNPFVRHEFLHALEESRCVSSDTGWTPCHLIASSSVITSSNVITGSGDKEIYLIAALPVYLKTHSYGEYVFDWAWADFYQQHGRLYYPKLVVGVPFSPITGPRLLTQTKDDHYQYLLDKFNEKLHLLAEECNASSIHWLFHRREDTKPLQRTGYHSRIGFQYHWENPGVDTFKDYLSNFKSKVRKNIRRERQHICDAGIIFTWKHGVDIDHQDIQNFYDFYLSTVDTHHAYAYLNIEFFQLIRDWLTNNISILMASVDGHLIASALFLENNRTLYGRYWGTNTMISGLHFETCYYQPIDYCLRNGIQYFNAGAQGDHKIRRGLLPLRTYSSHWIRDEALAPAIYNFLKHESSEIDNTIGQLNEHSPFKTTEF